MVTIFFHAQETPWQNINILSILQKIRESPKKFNYMAQVAQLLSKRE